MSCWPVLLLPLLLTACQGKADQPGDTLSNSVGARLVESSSPKWPEGQGWSVAESPSLDLATSGTGPAHEFEMVTDGLWLDDGRIAVADDGWKEVRFFTPSGEFMKSLGRPGEGPGEFRRIQTLNRWRGDSLVVFDQVLDRVTVLSAAGGVRTIPLGGPSLRPVHVRTTGESGLVGLFTEPAVRPSDPGVYRPPYFVLSLDGEGVVVDTLGQVGGRELYWAAGVDGRLVMGKNGQLAVRGLVAVFGDSDSLEYERHRVGVGQIQQVRGLGFDLTVSDQQVEEIRSLLRQPHDPPDVRTYVNVMPIPSSKPAYAKLLIDDEGCVWAASYRIPGAPEGPWTWEVFDSAGTWLGGVTIPDRFSPLEIGRDAVLGVWQDGLDVHHVQIRSLTRRL